MKESIINKKILAVMFGVIFIGSVAAILRIVRAPKIVVSPIDFV